MNQKLKIGDENYPQILQEISDPPELLFYRGNLDALNYKYAIAVVGTRRCSEYGREATRAITKELARAGITIISGLARGIDTVAHETALESGASTIAILGSPLGDKEIYPQQNVGLARKIIAAGGLLLSEYKPETPSYASNFPQRNRIVAGLSRGTLVVEAPLKSGARITARLSLEYNRDVYVVPGSVFSRLNEGSHDILKQGAKLVTSARDILEDIPQELLLKRAKAGTVPALLNNEERKVLELIGEADGPLHIDKIIQATKLSANDVAQITTLMVLQDLIKESSPNTFIVIK